MSYNIHRVQVTRRQSTSTRKPWLWLIGFLLAIQSNWSLKLRNIELFIFLLGGIFFNKVLFFINVIGRTFGNSISCVLKIGLGRIDAMQIQCKLHNLVHCSSLMLGKFGISSKLPVYLKKEATYRAESFVNLE